MKNIFKYIAILLVITSCESNLNQVPPLEAASSSLTTYTEVLNAAYHYQQASTTPLAVMGDFRADNMLMREAPYPAFDRFDKDLAGGDLVEQFFRPFYSNLYKSILSANNVISNSTNATQVAEAKFLRALSYFKLVKVFGDVTINLSASPSISDKSILMRQPAAKVYDEVIIPDFLAAISVLSNVSTTRATKIAAQGMLAKVYMQRSNFVSAAPLLAEVVSTATAAKISLRPKFSDVFGELNDLNSEIIYATRISTSINTLYSYSKFSEWFKGTDTKSPNPLDPKLTAAFDASTGDLRKDVTIDVANKKGKKWGTLDQDWIELRYADILLLHAEVLNETGSPAATVLKVLDPTVLNTKDKIKKAILDERRLELALEGQRWFDLVRTGTVDSEMGLTVNKNYYLFPIPNSEVLASGGVITQNTGY